MTTNDTPTNDTADIFFRVPVARLNRDLRKAAQGMSTTEARFLVDEYYMLQEQRIRHAAQHRSMSEAAEEAATLDWLGEQSSVLEKQVAAALDRYSAAHPIGQWMRGICGIGPVIAAGFLAHIDIEKAPTAGHIWAYAGLDPTKTWGKGQKRPWNARLKTLCWKTGESFVKVQNNPNDIYGKVYAARKAWETERNARGEYAEQAAKRMATRKPGGDTVAITHLREGRLPPAAIHERSKRYAVKLFLSHLHDVWYRDWFGEAPPLPYPIAHLGHAHYIAPPAVDGVALAGQR